MRISACSSDSFPVGYKQQEYFAYGPRHEIMNSVGTYEQSQHTRRYTVMPRMVDYDLVMLFVGFVCQNCDGFKGANPFDPLEFRSMIGLKRAHVDLPQPLPTQCTDCSTCHHIWYDSLGSDIPLSDTLNKETALDNSLYPEDDNQGLEYGQ